MFALISRREVQTAATLSDGSLRVRRAWTLLDRAYNHCRRALSFLRFEEGDADTLAPSLRRNAGPRQPSSQPEPAPTPSTAPTPPVTGQETPVVVAAPAFGGGSAPFMAKP
jgi:hypothetical protein